MPIFGAAESENILLGRCKRLQAATALAAACALLLCTACGSVTVRKVTDTDTKTKGFRYYLPRPYVVVNKPFAVAGDDFFAFGDVSSDGKVISLTATGLPDPIKHKFGVVQDAAGNEILLVPTALVRATLSETTPSRVPRAATAQSGTDATNSVVGIANDTWVTAPVTPNPLPQNQDLFKVKLTLAKAAGFDDVQAATIQIGLLPAKTDGTPDENSFIPLSTKTEVAWVNWVKGTTDGAYEVAGTRTALTEGASYAPAIRFKGKRTGETTENTFLAHRSNVEFSAIGVAARGTKSIGQQQNPSSTSPGTIEETMSSTGLVVGGDPQTDPHLKINDYFDIVYLPDFNQQYAVEVKAGLGMAAGGIGMENGWMVEKAAIQVDNRQLGQFIFRNLQNLANIGLAAISPESAAASAAAGLTGAPGTPSAAIAQAGRDQQPVLLRIRYLLEAQPGIYPILKSSEAEAAAKQTKPDYVLVPYPPVTAVGYNVRQTLAIELVDVRLQAPSRAQDDIKPEEMLKPDDPELLAWLHAYNVWAAKQQPPALTIDEKTSVDGATIKISNGATTLTIRIKSVDFQKATESLARFVIDGHAPSIRGRSVQDVYAVAK
jgi:hypothetical protein